MSELIGSLLARVGEVEADARATLEYGGGWDGQPQRALAECEAIRASLSALSREVGEVSTLTGFLAARIAEDAAVGRDWRHHPSKVQVVGGGDGYLRLANPDRVLAECGAKRRVLEEFGRYEGGGVEGYEVAADLALRLAALPYADHPDYRDEWRP